MKRIAGVGVNDYQLPVTRYEGKVQVWKCPIYTLWVNMLRRCYLESAHASHPTYKDVRVCEDWHSFSNFRSWAVEGYAEGLELDKDLLSPLSRIYSPETCMFVDKHINRFLSERKTDRQPYPIGITLDKRRNSFSVRGTNEYGCRVWLGYSADQENAHKLWQQHKLDIVRITAKTCTNKKLTDVLNRVILKLEYELSNNIETTALL